MATAISVIGLLVAAVIFVIAVWKGLDVFTSTILVSFIIILTSWMDWWDSLTLYASGYVGLFRITCLYLSSVLCSESLWRHPDVRNPLQTLSQKKWVRKE